MNKRYKSGLATLIKKILIMIIATSLSACSINHEEVINTTSPSQEIERPQEEVDKLASDSLAYGAYDYWQYDNTIDHHFNLSSIEVDFIDYANIYEDDVYLKKGSYTFSFNLVSDDEIAGYFEVWDDQDKLIESFNIQNGSNEIVFETDIDLYSAYLNMRLISDKEIKVKINDFKINRDENIAIFLNQVGYLNKGTKVAISKYAQGNYFSIVDAKTNQALQHFSISEEKYSEDAEEFVAYLDFSKFKKSGTYYLESSFGYRSEIFSINNNIYDDLYNDALSFFYRQRCGQEVISNDINHSLCHDNEVHIYGTTNKTNIVGGWHDAGDYGRYTETATKAINDLLLAYMLNKDEKILDEVQYELDFLLSMQREDGLVYSRIVTKKFPGLIKPEDDKEMQFIMLAKSASTAGFVSVMALASYIYADIDYDKSEIYKEAAIKSYEALINVDEYNPILPGDFNAGDYNIAAKEYYMFSAGISMWLMTADEYYLDDAFYYLDLDNIKFNTLYYNPLMIYPTYLYLLNGDKDTYEYEILNELFYDYVLNIANRTNNDAYRISLESYSWGSNATLLDETTAIILGYKLYGEDNLLYRAYDSLDYILGRNSLNMSYVVGYGTNYPKDIHHRLAKILEVEFKGALVGGANQSGEDYLVSELFDYPIQKRYVDNYDSYSTNEVSIIYNSALVFNLAFLKGALK